jgi:hypothetical protein
MNLFSAQLSKTVLSWAINQQPGNPATEVRIDFAYKDTDGEDRYAVRLGDGQCVNKQGDWVADDFPHSAYDGWLLDHRFELWEAEVLAYEAARTLWAQRGLVDA